MGLTQWELPYPEPTDPVADGANAIRDLAEFIDTYYPRGIQGYSWGPGSDIPGIGAAVYDVPGMVIGFPVYAGHTYKVTATVCFMAAGAYTVVPLMLRNGLDQVTIQTSTGLFTDYVGSSTVTEIFAAEAAGTEYRKVSLQSNGAGSVTYVGSYTREGLIAVEDIGVSLYGAAVLMEGRKHVTDLDHSGRRRSGATGADRRRRMEGSDRESPVRGH